MSESVEQSGNKGTGAKSSPSPFLKLALEFGPLIAFFVAFKFAGIFVATAVFMIAITTAMIISKRMVGHVTAAQKLTFVIVMVMGGLTIYLNDETFVKMKPTIINAIMGSILVVGLFRKRYYLKMIMESGITMDDVGWRVFSRNFAVFMLSMAALNEFIWRTQSTDFWVNFKTFGYMGLMFVFIITQVPMLAKYMPDEEG